MGINNKCHATFSPANIWDHHHFHRLAEKEK